MKAPTKVARSRLTAYEAEQVRQIAAWKSIPPNAFAALARKITLPAARVVERALPEPLMRGAIERACSVSQVLAAQADVKAEAGVRNLRTLRFKSLEMCDQLARQVSTSSRTWALIQGALTGSGGIFTTLLDIPLLFVLSLRTIRKVGYCYGFHLNGDREERFVLGILIAATAGTLATKHARLEQLKEVEDLLLEETEEDILSEEAMAVLFQLELFGGIPAIGAISGALLNLAFIRRVDRTAMHVFQERWLRDNRKVRRIAPADPHARHLAPGWTGALGRVADASAYAIGFGAALPVWSIASAFSRNGHAKSLARPTARGS